MLKYKLFVFNFIQVNCYILWDETYHAVIIDPGCYLPDEKKELVNFISKNKLIPSSIIFTHPHFDHVMGAKFLKDTYNIPIIVHKEGDKILSQTQQYSESFGFNGIQNVQPDIYTENNEFINFGNSSLKVLYTPGHADGSICLYSENNNLLFSGDVLFRQSIGRTDLPTGNYEMLIENIKSHLLTLPENTIVLPGHGEQTTIGFEKNNNPYL